MLAAEKGSLERATSAVPVSSGLAESVTRHLSAIMPNEDRLGAGLFKLLCVAAGAFLLVWTVQRRDARPMGGSVTPASTVPVVSPMPTPARRAPLRSTPTRTTRTATGTIIWKAGDPVLGNWAVSNTYQCGTPVNTGATFTFNLIRNGTNCGRNQATPLHNANPNEMFFLADGSTFTWEFDYIDGTPTGAAPGMGLDTDARSLIWQIHGYNEQGSPCTGLTFMNGPDGVSSPQMWGLGDCSGTVWVGTYKPGERDHFKIVAKISTGSTGFIEIYRDGVFQAHHDGANYHNSQGNPWWNFGPYKWRWELAGGGGSNMTQVNATINNMVVTKQ
jgi:hypothetical protein